MIHKLFEDFLDNVEQYKACEIYWEDLVRKLSNSIGQEEEWERWNIRQYANGTPFELDGNPIFAGCSKRYNRAFRVVQHRAIGNEVEVVAWLKEYEEEYIDLPSSELVINLSLSEESVQIVGALLIKWMMPDTDPEDMESVISSILPKINK